MASARGGGRRLLAWAALWAGAEQRFPHGERGRSGTAATRQDPLAVWGRGLRHCRRTGCLGRSERESGSGFGRLLPCAEERGEPGPALRACSDCQAEVWGRMRQVGEVPSQQLLLCENTCPMAGFWIHIVCCIFEDIFWLESIQFCSRSDVPAYALPGF